LAGNYPFDETKPVSLPGNASTMVAEFDAKSWDKLGVTTHVAFATLTVACKEVARDAFILPLFREMKWAKARVNVRRKEGQAIFTSNTFAWRVCLDLNGERALPDNFFDVYPGIPTVLDWPQNLGQPKILRVGNG
jgi:beta-mannosidase